MINEWLNSAEAQTLKEQDPERFNQRYREIVLASSPQERQAFQPATDVSGGAGKLDPTQFARDPDALKKILEGMKGSPRPEMPAFESLRDPATGLLKPQYQTQLGPYGYISANDDALKALREKGLAQGPSAWAQMATQQQGLEEQKQRSGLAERTASAEALARSQLASKGGLSSAQAAMLASNLGRQAIMGQQQVGREGALDRLKIGMADEDTKNKILGQLPGMELNRTALDERNRALGIDIQNQNINRALGDVTQQRAFDLGKYQEQMKGYAAEKTGQAYQNSSGGKK